MKEQKSSSTSVPSCTDDEMEVEMEQQQEIVNELQEEEKELELVEFDGISQICVNCITKY